MTASADDTVRVDRWLWAVRLFKTRSLAAAACRGGHVRINGISARPAKLLKVGDQVSARVGDRDRALEVVELIDKRVGAPIAATCYVDHTPPSRRTEHVAPMFHRERGTGRPTKKERRQLDRFRGRG